ncbi:hypothetical protein [Bremerella sp.]|uniref:hypothetical protein n=1 Tax=Bremerella sp. TaxID=2795602 RepID=UPI00391C19E6
MLKIPNHNTSILYLAFSIVLAAVSIGCSDTPNNAVPSASETFSSFVMSLEGAVKTAHPQELSAASQELAQSAALASQSTTSRNKDEVDQLIDEFQKFSDAATQETKNELLERIDKMKSIIAKLDD